MTDKNIVSANSAYKNHIDVITTYGSAQAARGLSFVEFPGLSYTVQMSDPVITLADRKMGFAFAAAEPYWILSGSNLLNQIGQYGKMAPYSDDGYFMRGAYGPKIIDQLPYICRTLADDDGSRQAVLNIWRERPEKSKDIPCTVAMQFMIRDGKLNCYTFMRSSDAIMGLPYDSILFSLVSAYVLSIRSTHYAAVDVELGELTIFIGSAHVYERDLDWAFKIKSGTAIDDKAIDGDTDDLIAMDFNKLAKLPPSLFLEMLSEYKDADRGIIEMGYLK